MCLAQRQLTKLPILLRATGSDRCVMQPREATTEVRINIRGTVGSRWQLKAAELNSLSRFDDSLLGL